MSSPPRSSTILATSSKSSYDRTADALILIAVIVWFALVQNVVPEPYLDEVFHVRQAENYVRGSWRVWDPKITTPPGLYFVSYLHIWLFKSIGILPMEIIGPKVYRSVNAIASTLLALTVRCLMTVIHESDEKEQPNQDYRQWSIRELISNNVNICLFPPLFFFYGLYYTDVLSALSVLCAYQCYLKKQNGATTVFAGLLSLLFRQTNIFWVSLFLGGLAFCRAIPKVRDGTQFPKEPTFYDVIDGSWQYAAAYDPLISQASFEDYMKSGASYAIAGLANFPGVLKSIVSYLLVLSTFVGFVIWNGGVVLGDKENHSVSIHLAQMLYIWPYFVFFSIPLLYPFLLNILIPQRLLPSPFRSETVKSQLPRLVIALPTMAIMLVTVHYNTLIHPFTLADNRHYTFYVFRILLHNPSIKYLAVPIYFICASAAIAALTGPIPQSAPISARKRETQPQNAATRAFSSSSDPVSERGNRVSFLLLWLLATSASLVTAPLVEPRYFIVPWLIWRLHITPPNPAVSPAKAPQCNDAATGEKIEIVKEEATASRGYDHRLWLETAWFLTVNAGIGYIFLCWGFEWPQEPGKVQRFMW